MNPVKILYLDDHLAAVYKPAGLLVHRSDIARGQDHQFAVQLVRDQLGQPVYPAHRLDRKTAGVLLFALDAETMRRLKESFEAHQVEKRYLAVVRGHAPEKGMIARPLKQAFLTSAQKKVAEPKPAVTHFQRLATIELPIAVGRYESARYALLEVTPHSGRTHQIRRHLAGIAHPIVGDTRYGDSAHNRMFRDEFESYRMFLIAQRLAFPHPHEDKIVDIRAELDGEISSLVERLGFGEMANG